LEPGFWLQTVGRSYLYATIRESSQFRALRSSRIYAELSSFAEGVNRHNILASQLERLEIAGNQWAAGAARIDRVFECCDNGLERERTTSFWKL
jgi:hypothetical protein